MPTKTKLQPGMNAFMSRQMGEGMKRAVCNFFAGLVISYTIEVLVMTLAVILTGEASVPVFMLMEGFALAACCSLIGAFFSADRLSFPLQAVLTYISSFAVIMIFSFMFKWYELGPDILNGKSFFGVIIGLFTAGYIITMLIRRSLQKKSMIRMNEKLMEYKENNKKRKETE